MGIKEYVRCALRYFVALKGRAPSRRVNAESENVLPFWPKRMGAAGRLSLGWTRNLAALCSEVEALCLEAEALVSEVEALVSDCLLYKSDAADE